MSNVRRIAAYGEDGQLIFAGLADLDEVVETTDAEGNTTYSFTAASSSTVTEPVEHAGTIRNGLLRPPTIEYTDCLGQPWHITAGTDGSTGVQLGA